MQLPRQFRKHSPSKQQPLRGEIFKEGRSGGYFWEGGRILHGGTWHFMDLKTLRNHERSTAKNRSGATPAAALIYPRLSTDFYRFLVFFTNLSRIEFQVRYLALFLLFPLISNFRWFWMGNLHKNIQSILEFPKGPFLVLQFSYYTLLTFLIMLPLPS